MSFKRFNYQDFDEFAASVREADCKMMVQNPDIHRWSLTIAKTGSIEVQFGELGTGNIVEGKSWKDGILLYAPLSPKTRYRLNGRTLKSDAFMIVEPNGHFDLSSNGAHDWCSVFLPVQIMSGKNGSRPRSYATAANPALSRQFRSLVDAVLKASEVLDGFSQSAAGFNAERELTNICRQILRPDGMEIGTVCGRKKLNRDQIVQAAKDIAKNGNYSSVRIDEISERLDVSVSTLRNVFHDYYSIGPKGFFDLISMRNVRDDLILSDPNERSIAQILCDHGIFQFGRFAAKYCKIYGEKPSETLKKRASQRTMQKIHARLN